MILSSSVDDLDRFLEWKTVATLTWPRMLHADV